MKPKEVKIEDVSAVVKRLSVTLPQTEVEKELARTYRQLARNVKIKGFRPGKAPRFVLERHYGPRINQDVASRLIDQSWPAAVKDHDLQPVVQPTIEEQHFEPGQDFSYTARIEVRPAIDLEDLSGLETEPPQVEVTEAMIDEQVERLRDSQATLAPIDEDRPVQAGDWVTVNYRILVDGQALEGGQVENHDLEVGAGRFNDTVEAKLIGAARDQALSVEVDFPADHGEPRLAGKRAVFEMTVVDIRQKILPPLDDDLAKSLRVEADTLAALRDKISEDLREREQQKAEEEVRRTVLDKLHQRVEFELPPSLVTAEIETMVDSIKQRLAQAGADPEAAGINEDKLRQDFRPAAETKLKDQFLLAHVATRHDIKATPEDETRELEKMAARYKQSVALLREFYTKNQLLDGLRSRIVEQKTLKFLTSGANISDSGAAEAADKKSGGEPGTGDQVERKADD